MGSGASAKSKFEEQERRGGSQAWARSHTEPAIRKTASLPKENADAFTRSKSVPSVGATHSLIRKSVRHVVPEVLQSERAGSLLAKGFNDCKWHKQHCSDKDLQGACSIFQAYPFDDADTKTIERGKVSVAKLPPRKLNCCKCGKVVADRRSAIHALELHGDYPFMYCLRCRKEGKPYFVLCTNCYNVGAFATGARTKVDAAELCEKLSDHKLGGSVTHRKISLPVRKESTASDSSDASFRSTASVRSLGKPHGSIPSGQWIGQYYEGASGRQAERKIQFCQDGYVHGDGASCTLNGSLEGTKVTWREIYDWGSMKIDGEIDFTGARPRICGKFSASDGGGGMVKLTLDRKYGCRF